MHTIKKALTKLLFLSACILSVKIAVCQPFEIRAVNKGLGVIGVEMRVTGGSVPKTTDYITDLVFGIKWSASYNVELTDAITTSYNMKRAGIRSQKNNFYFQAFYSDPIGYNPPSDWQLDNWVEIMSIANTRTGIDTGTFQIAEKNFDVTTDPNMAINFTDYTPTINGDANGVLLPVKLIRFEAAPANRMIRILWATANELNNKEFEIERSDEESNNFKRIGQVNSKANSNINNDYEFLDKNVITKVRYYYRLKQMDKDGQYKYSEIRTAVLNDKENKAVLLRPNPADKILQILFNNNVAKEELVLKIMDAKGSVVLTRTYYLDISKRIDLNVSNLITGHYFISIENNKGLISTNSFQKR